MEHLKFILLICLLASTGSANAQSDPVDRREYRAWMIGADTILAKPVRFVGAGDSCIWIAAWDPMGLGTMSISAGHLAVPIVELSAMQFRRVGSVGRTMTVFVPLALLVGMIAGHKKIEDSSPYAAAFGIKTHEFKPAYFAIGAGACLGVGLLIGSARKTVRIDRSPSRYKRIRKALDGYAEPL